MPQCYRKPWRFVCTGCCITRPGLTRIKMLSCSFHPLPSSVSVVTAMALFPSSHFTEEGHELCPVEALRVPSAAETRCRADQTEAYKIVIASPTFTCSFLSKWLSGQSSASALTSSHRPCFAAVDDAAPDLCPQLLCLEVRYLNNVATFADAEENCLPHTEVIPLPWIQAKLFFFPPSPLICSQRAFASESNQPLKLDFSGNPQPVRGRDGGRAPPFLCC